MRTGLRVNFVKVHKVNNIIIDCAERNAEPFRKIIDAILFLYVYKSSIISLRRISTSDTPSPPLISLNPILNVISAKTLH